MGLLLILLSMTQYGHWAFCYVACGLLCPISSWASSALSNFVFPWAFINSFGLPWPNYFILHLLGLWIFHQPLTLFTCITLGLSWPILTFLHHVLPVGLLLLSFQASLCPFTSSRPIYLFYKPMIHYSYCLGLMAFLSNY